MSDHAEDSKCVGLIAAIRQIEASWSDPIPAVATPHSQHIWFEPGCDECRRDCADARNTAPVQSHSHEETGPALVKQLAPEPINPGIL